MTSRRLTCLLLIAAVLQVARPAEAAPPVIAYGCGDTVMVTSVLAGPIFNCTDPAALTIGADNITLNLDGHAVTGDIGCSRAIDLPTGRTGVRVTNGILRQCDAGVVIADGTGNRVDRLLISQQFVEGVHVDGGTKNILERNRILSNPNGIRLGDAATKNTVRDNLIASGMNGIVSVVSVGSDNVVKRNEVISNTVNGMSLNGTSHQVIGNTVAGNGNVGIFAGGGSTIRANIVRDNQGATGLQAGSFLNVLENRFESNNGFGASVGSNSVLRGNRFIANAGSGLNAGSNNQIARNIALRNGGDGLRANADNRFVANRAERNAGSGIVNQDGTLTLLRENTSLRNDGDGIVVVGGTPSIVKNLASRNGFPGGGAAGDNFGIRATSSATGSKNVAKNNDTADPAVQCDPAVLC